MCAILQHGLPGNATNSADLLLRPAVLAATKRHKFPRRLRAVLTGPGKPNIREGPGFRAGAFRWRFPALACRLGGRGCGGRSSIGRAPRCGRGGCGFKSRRPPHPLRPCGSVFCPPSPCNFPIMPAWPSLPCPCGMGAVVRSHRGGVEEGRRRSGVHRAAGG